VCSRDERLGEERRERQSRRAGDTAKCPACGVSMDPQVPDLLLLQARRLGFRLTGEVCWTGMADGSEDPAMTSGLATRLREATQGPAHRWWVLAAVECGNFVVYVDGFLVTLALPAMARHFGVGIHEIKWVVVAYLAALTVTLLLAGSLADRWGRK